MKKRVLPILTITLMAFSFSMLLAQVPAAADSSNQSDMVYVRWVSEFPSPDIKSSRNGVFGRIGKFVFGQKPTVLINPVAVFANNPDKYWTLDQKSNSVALIEEQKGSTLRPKSKLEQLPSSLVSMCMLPNGSFLITDSRIGRVFLLSNDGKSVTLLNDSLRLQQPTGIAYAKARHEIWVLETKEHRIVILNIKGELIRTIGSRGNDAGKFNYPTHIWIDDQEMVYIVDAMNFRVQIFNVNGDWVSMFGSAGDASGYFARPKGIATDSHGNIYVADALFHTIQIFNSKGHFLYNFGSQGRESGDFWLPNGIYIDSKDYIYVADSYNARVQVFQLINHE
jgi:DNA-binding beta-propeller fold protein YncE